MNAAFGVRFAFLGDLDMPSFALLSTGRQEGSPQQLGAVRGKLAVAAEARWARVRAEGKMTR
jgi:hypothetical protein